MGDGALTSGWDGLDDGRCTWRWGWLGRARTDGETVLHWCRWGLLSKLMGVWWWLGNRPLIRLGDRVHPWLLGGREMRGL